MSRGKHSCDDEFELGNIPWKIIGIVILVIAIIIGIFFGGKTVYSTFIANGKLFKKDKEEKIEEVISIEEEKIPTNLYGYNVLGKLTIKSKEFSEYILEVPDNNVVSNDSVENTLENENIIDNNVENNTSNSKNPEELSNALKKGIVKLYGDKVNCKGNFCIIGHNEKERFAILNELKVKDEFEIENSSKEKNKYIITEIFTVDPTDLKCLMPNDKYKEVTLITCTTGSNQRLVVKALEENDYKLSLKESDNTSIENTNNQDNSSVSNTVE